MDSGSQFAVVGHIFGSKEDTGEVASGGKEAIHFLSE
jgi:hypothetical protein